MGYIYTLTFPNYTSQLTFQNELDLAFIIEKTDYT